MSQPNLLTWQDASQKAWSAYNNNLRGLEPGVKATIFSRYRAALADAKADLIQVALGCSIGFNAAEYESEIAKFLGFLDYLAKNPLNQLLGPTDGVTKRLLAPYGPWAAYGAYNYPVCESPLGVCALGQSIQMGVPMVAKLGSSTEAIDIAMWKILKQVIDSVDDGPTDLPDFYSLVAVSREESEAFLKQLAFLHFTGGDIGHELAAHTISGTGNIQAGQRNTALVFKGGEVKAATIIGSAVGPSGMLSCSAYSWVILMPGAEAELFQRTLLEVAAESIEKRGEVFTPHHRFVDSLDKSIRDYLSNHQGALQQGAEIDQLTVGTDFALVQVPCEILTKTSGAGELFGRSLAWGQLTGDVYEHMQLLPNMKTLGLYGEYPDEVYYKALHLAGRIACNTKPSTPSMSECLVHSNGGRDPSSIDPFHFLKETCIMGRS